MTKKKLLRSLTIRLIILIIVVCIFHLISNSIGVVINNVIAMDQFENDDFYLVEKEIFELVKNIADLVPVIVRFILVVLSAYDVIKFYKGE